MDDPFRVWTVWIADSELLLLDADLKERKPYAKFPVGEGGVFRRKRNKDLP
jgi:hypothetical protein